MRLLLVNSFYSPNVVGGAERSVERLARSLVKRGHEVAVVSLNPSSSQRESAVVQGVKVYYLPLRNLYMPIGGAKPDAFRKAIWHTVDTYNMAMASLFEDILCYEKPDIVNTHNLAGFSVAIWDVVKRYRLPLVHTTHDHYLLCPRSTMFRGGRNCAKTCFDCGLYAWLRRRMTALVDAVIGVSRYVLDRHLNYGYFTGSKRYIVYNGYDAPQHDMAQNRVERSRPERNGISPFRFGYLGHLHPTKGVELLLRSFLALPPGKAELWVAGRGDPDYEAKLRGMVADRDDVRWLGFVTPEELLESVDVLVVPSLLRETFSLVVLEAMGNGVPVVGAGRGAIPEVLGEAGWIFDPDKPGALEAQLMRCLECPDEVRAMSQRAKDRARLFSLENMLSGYLRIYETLLEVAL